MVSRRARNCDGLAFALGALVSCRPGASRAPVEAGLTSKSSHFSISRTGTNDQASAYFIEKVSHSSHTFTSLAISWVSSASGTSCGAVSARKVGQDWKLSGCWASIGAGVEAYLLIVNVCGIIWVDLALGARCSSGAVARLAASRTIIATTSP